MDDGRAAPSGSTTSDLALDAGSLSIVDAGAFASEESIEPLTPRDRRLVSFAVDLGVQEAARPGGRAVECQRLDTLYVYE